jgi:aldehyde dehydrogenase (NAD+)/succinate-semialdehyde dehydrogenase/glutarate-semialdehyde dehydrogenase
LPEVHSSGDAELEAVIDQARAAAPAFAAMPFEERAAALSGFAADAGRPEAIERVAATMCEEMGKPIAQARAEARTVSARMSMLLDSARTAVASEVGREGDLEVTVEWCPVGVVAVIAPWNYPISTPNNLIVSALATGNTVVFKPSELTPRTGARYCELLRPHLPPGVLGLVQGGGAVGRALVESAVDMIAFTGSIATGQQIMREAAVRMKRLVLEMGGKDPMIVLPGADLDAAARHAAQESVRNSGQVCVSVERVFVPRSVAESFAQSVARTLSAMRVGDPRDEATELGPMASERQRALVLEQLADAERRGGRFVLRGEASGPGFFLTPSVVVDVEDDFELAREETFGPVVAISVYDDVDDAVRRANATRYGLGASVWGPEGAAEAVAGRIEAGMVGINRGLSAAGGAPWVGWKMSGFGYTRSSAGMRQFMQPRSLTRVRRAPALV